MLILCFNLEGPTLLKNGPCAYKHDVLVFDSRSIIHDFWSAFGRSMASLLLLFSMWFRYLFSMLLKCGNKSLELHDEYFAGSLKNNPLSLYPYGLGRLQRGWAQTLQMCPKARWWIYTYIYIYMYIYILLIGSFRPHPRNIYRKYTGHVEM